jgi:hypothetical protein
MLRYAEDVAGNISVALQVRWLNFYLIERRPPPPPPQRVERKMF